MTTATQTDQSVLELEIQQGVTVKEEATALAITDDTTETAAQLIIVKCREAERRLDAERKDQTDPLRSRIELIAEPYKKAIEFYAAIRGEVDRRLKAYQLQRQRAREAEQQRLLEEKRQADAEATADAAKKAEEARQLEEKMKAKPTPLTAKEQEKLVKVQTAAATAQETAAVQAATPVQVVTSAPKTTVLGDGTKVTASSKKTWIFQNGLPKETVFTRADQRFRDIPDSYFVFDPKLMNAAVKAHQTPPGVVIVDDSTTKVTPGK